MFSEIFGGAVADCPCGIRSSGQADRLRTMSPDKQVINEVVALRVKVLSIFVKAKKGVSACCNGFQLQGYYVISNVYYPLLA